MQFDGRLPFAKEVNLKLTNLADELVRFHIRELGKD
jgi:hypothetical protein